MRPHWKRRRARVLHCWKVSYFWRSFSYVAVLFQSLETEGLYKCGYLLRRHPALKMLMLLHPPIHPPIKTTTKSRNFSVFTWDDWFRLETLDDSLQPTIDMLLNVSIFMWYGTVCPWNDFLHNSVVPIYRLIPLGILILLFRRLPWILAVHKYLPQIEEIRHAIFVGFFGPVGVSAIFYLYITLEFVEGLKTSDGKPRADVSELGEAVTVVVWFIAICSIVGYIHASRELDGIANTM